MLSCVKDSNASLSFAFQYFVFDFHMAPVMLFDKIITLSVSFLSWLFSLLFMASTQQECHIYRLDQWIGNTFDLLFSKFYYRSHQKCFQFTGPNCTKLMESANFQGNVNVALKTFWPDNVSLHSDLRGWQNLFGQSPILLQNGAFRKLLDIPR